MSSGDFSIGFVARWQARVIPADNIGGTYGFTLPDRFIAVQEVYKPYGLDPAFTDSECQNILLGANAVDLAPSFAGHNIDLSSVVIASGRRITKRIFDVNNIAEGDAIMVLVPQM